MFTSIICGPAVRKWGLDHPEAFASLSQELRDTADRYDRQTWNSYTKSRMVEAMARVLRRYPLPPHELSVCFNSVTRGEDVMLNDPIPVRTVHVY